MNKHIDLQVIKIDGKPAFAVLPWKQYEELLSRIEDEDESDVWFPHEVVKANVRGDTLVKAWREYLGLTQQELAKKAGMKQASIARIEAGKTTPRKTTLKRLADAMGISVEQLLD